MRFSALLALGGAALSQAAALQGFNYGSTNSDGSIKQQSDFETLFNRAKNLPGTSGFTSARLYTMIQGGTANGISSAIPAAINTQTTLLLGLWASAGQDDFNNELSALSSAIKQYGTSFTSLIAGISVGSEDLYRESPTGIENKSGAGASPDQLVSYISQVRAVIKGTAASAATVGHVDTWTAWVNGSNSAVTQAVDWLGMDGYPYFQNTEANSIEAAPGLFFDSYNATVAASLGKPVWITETGWPVSGPTENQAVPSPQNAELYWQGVACHVLGDVNTFWFTLQDAYPVTPSPSFGIIGYDINSAPLYDLTCSAADKPSSSASSSAAASSKSVATSTVQQHSTTQQQTTAAATTVPAKSSVSTPEASHTASTAPAVSSSPAQTSSGCPANLDGPYQFPHLIVPVDSGNPSKAYGTSYDGTISPTISSIFNFDIPSSYAGKTCSLVFLFPEKSALETSSFTFNGQGGIKVDLLSGPATQATTYDNVPAIAKNLGTLENVAPGNSYTVFTDACGAGERVGFEFSSVGGLDLTYFQDYNPSPIGAYITVC